jgi:hypothetical protein
LDVAHHPCLRWALNCGRHCVEGDDIPVGHHIGPRLYSEGAETDNCRTDPTDCMKS